MAVMKYEINGKADTKPIKDTEKAVQGLFTKVSAIDNKLKGFVGVAVFQEVGKAVSNALQEYDKFQSSLNSLDNLNISKQFDSIKTTFSGTLGAVRDNLIETLNTAFGGENNFLKTIEEIIPKIGSNIIAAMGVAEQIVKNIKTNFSNLIKPETWNEFFTHASDLASKFGPFFANILKDVFHFAVDYFRWALENMNLLLILLKPSGMLFEKLAEGLKVLGAKIPIDKLKNFLNEANEAAKKVTAGTAPAYQMATRPNMAMPAIPPVVKVEPVTFENFPKFGLSENSVKALDDFTKALKDTFNEGVSALAGTDAAALFKQKQEEAFDQISALIAKMKEPPPPKEPPKPKEPKEEGPDLNLKALNKDLSGANKWFSDANSRINNILGGATGKGADEIREKMKGFNLWVDKISERIDGLFDDLKNAGSADEVAQISEQIRGSIGEINNLSAATAGLAREARKAKGSFDLLQGALQSIGELGAVIKAVIDAVMSGNPIGLIITLISRLADVFSKISGGAAAAQNILTVFFDIIEDIAVTLGPMLDAVFKPFVEIIAAIGRIVGSLLTILSPFLGILTIFLPILDPIVWLLNKLALGFAYVADGIAHVWNFIANLIEKITFGVVKLTRLSTDNVDRMKSSIEGGVDYEQYQDGSNSTSYSVAGDMYINIYFSHSYVNGDARQIAVALRNEIRSAEKAGY
jgi:hypothetical protein